MSGLATAGYEAARARIAQFLNAKDYREIVFTKNASEALNLVAYSWGLANLQPGDEVMAYIERSFSCTFQFRSSTSEYNFKFHSQSVKFIVSTVVYSYLLSFISKQKTQCHFHSLAEIKFSSQRPERLMQVTKPLTCLPLSFLEQDASRSCSAAGLAVSSRTS